MKKVISLFMLLLILASCYNSKKKDKNKSLKQSILAVEGLNSLEGSSSTPNQNIDLAKVILSIEVGSITTSSGSLTLNFYSSDANIKNYEVSKDKGEWESIENQSVYTSSGFVVDKTYNFEIRAKHNNKYGPIFNKTVLFKDGFVWSNLSLSWKKAIAENVSSISGTETSLIDAQKSAFFNLTRFEYRGNKKSYDDKLKILSPVKYMTQLTALYLSSNKITSIPSEIKSLSSLVTLNLDNNKITSIPNEITSLSSLTSLSLGGSFTTIPSKITSLSSLTSLSLGGSLTAIPSEITSLSRLTDLDLRFNKITSIESGAFKGLSSLKTLGLSSNQITSIPSEITSLSSLDNLNLSYNKITSIPSEIKSLSSLDSLNLSSNKITSIPSEIKSLSSLVTLNLSSNKITSIPNEIKSLSSLTWLNLSYNQLTSIPSAIKSLSSLSKLYLNNNQLRSLASGAFIGLSRLEILSLNNNKITSIESGAFNGLTNLTLLELQKNQITSIPASSFNHMDRLYELNLKNQYRYTWTNAQKTAIRAQVKATTSDGNGGLIHFDNSTSLLGTRS